MGKPVTHRVTLSPNTRSETMIQSNNKTIYEALGRGPVHPFPARMAPGIALDVLAEATRSLRVLDPMVGSGTVLALARSKGHRGIGVDNDPLAVLISKVWTMACDPGEVRDKAGEVLARAQGIFASLPSRDAYPREADKETRRFLAYWFDPYVRRQLAALSTAINRVRDEAIRNTLWCAFSRLIITKQSGASLAADLAHSRPHKFFERAPRKPFRNFFAEVSHVVNNSIHGNSPGRGPAPRIYEGDARTLPLTEASVDLVLTSPPYLNAIDYMRCSKFSLVWMGYSVAELRQLRTESVGAETGKGTVQDDPVIRDIMAELDVRPRLPVKHEMMLSRYIDDMRHAVREVARVLSPGGKAAYVVGENTIQGTYIRNSKIISALAQLSGLRLYARRARTLPANRRYLPPPSAEASSAKLDARIRREVVLVFTKPVR